MEDHVKNMMQSLDIVTQTSIQQGIEIGRKECAAKIAELESDRMTLVLRLYGESEDTFAPETREVMRRCKPLATALLRGEIADAEPVPDKYRACLETLRKYCAIESNDERGQFVALAYDGSIIGPMGRTDYPLYEFAEAVEKWLHDKIDAALSASRAGGQGEGK